MGYTIRLEQSPGFPLAVVRRRASAADLARVVPEACGTVWNVIRSQQVTGAGRHVAIYWDSAINLDVGVELDTPFAGHGEVVGSSLPAGLAAATTHYGPYGKLGIAHDAIHNWCRINGRQLSGPRWEIYGHWQDEWNRDPSLIRTDVFYLLDANAADSGGE